MPHQDEFATLDAVAQAELVRTGEVAPIELVEAAIQRIDWLNPKINAVITSRYEKALQDALSPDLPKGPFRGVPILLKDFFLETEGDPYYAGMGYLRDLGWHSQHDTYLAQQLRQAGFIFLGKTNLPELAGPPTTEPIAFGATRNPWDLSRTAGGSSGGSAAAVASGMVAVAHANDGTGSIRGPASNCGLVGLKPSRGRISAGPKRSSGIFGNITELVLSRTVRDTAAVLDAVQGAMPGDLFVALPPNRPYVDELGRDPRRLRVAMLVHDPFLEIDVHPEVVEAVEATGKIFLERGDVVDYGYPPAFDGQSGLGFGGAILGSSGLAATLDAWAERTGKPITQDDVEPATWERAEEGRRWTAVQVHEAYQRLVAGICQTTEWWSEGIDLLITPTLAQLPAPLGLDSENLFHHVGLFTVPFSYSGQPAISLPLHWSSDGLPIGVQIVADYGREDLLIRVASLLEQVKPWKDRIPPNFSY